MRVSLYGQIALKDRPGDFLGMTGESFTIGKGEEATLEDMAIGTISRLAEYMGLCYEAEELNRQLDEIAAFCKHVRFKQGLQE